MKNFDQPPGGSTREGEQCNANPEASPLFLFLGRGQGGADAPFTPGGWSGDYQ